MVSYHSFPFHQAWHSPWNTQKQLAHAVSPLDTAQKQIHFVHSAQTIECCAINMNFHTALLAHGCSPFRLTMLLLENCAPTSCVCVARAPCACRPRMPCGDACAPAAIAPRFPRPLPKSAPSLRSPTSIHGAQAAAAGSCGRVITCNMFNIPIYF